MHLIYQSHPIHKTDYFADVPNITPPSTEMAVFVDGERILKGPSTKTGVFMDGGGVSRSSSTKTGVFMDGRQARPEECCIFAVQTEKSCG